MWAILSNPSGTYSIWILEYFKILIKLLMEKNHCIQAQVHSVLKLGLGDGERKGALAPPAPQPNEIREQNTTYCQ